MKNPTLTLLALASTLFAASLVHAADAQPASIEPNAQPASAPAERAIRVGSPGNLFSTIKGNQGSGFILEAASSAFASMGMAPRFVAMPTSDALAEIKAGALDAALVVVPSASASEASWTSDPILTELNVIVTLKDKAFSLRKLDDLKGKRIMARDNRKYPRLQGAEGIALTIATSNGEMLRALLLGTIDAAVVSSISDVYALRAEGLISDLTILESSVGSVPLSVSLSKKSFTKEEAEKFNASLKAFKASESWNAALDRNGLGDLIAPMREAD